MNTPICDFVKSYAEQNKIRLHMPGHKGGEYLGCEALDITEVSGADSLYEAKGIIAESEANASTLFGADTFYSTEGSSHTIRAMLCLCLANAKEQGARPIILAGRNAHKSFISAAALLDFDVQWVYPDGCDSYLSCTITAQKAEDLLSQMSVPPAALYITSPDYLGNMADIKALAEVCHRYGTLLAVDNAHGAYLKFLEPSQHPMDMGADICCDSAHKTLPVLTGGAYLHISPNLPHLSQGAKNALALFGSTSPSYLILQSLDRANEVISEGYSRRLSELVLKVNQTKQALAEGGYTLIGNELMKITIDAKAYGYSGTELAKALSQQGIEWEFADEDFIVLMPSADTKATHLDLLKSALLNIPKAEPILTPAPDFFAPQRAMSIREATFSPSEILPLYECEGRVLSQATVACPPAVPILVSGEVIDQNAIKRFEYYEIENLTVKKDV